MYLDVDGIDSLFAQTVDRLETELTQIRGKEKGAKGGGKIGIGGILGTLLGSGTVGVEGELSSLSRDVEEATMSLTVEHKLSRLLEFLGAFKGEGYFDDLFEAAERCAEASELVYVLVRAKFDAPQFYPGAGGAIEVNAAGAIQFELKKERNEYVMSAGLAKFTRLKGHFGVLSHEAILFGEYRGKEIPLSLFGYMVALKPPRFQMKPYAIWFGA